MPAQRLTQPQPALYRMTMDITHFVYELHPTVGFDLTLEFTDGERYNVGHFEQSLDDLDAFARLPQDLTDAFLWGDGARGVVSTIAGFDKSRQSRRVRGSMPAG